MKLFSKNIKLKAHFIAFLTIFIWSITFVQTKVLLNYLSADEILIDRFLLALIFFWLIKPKFISTTLKEEVLFLFLGLSGIFGYYSLENYALKYSTSINVGLIVTTAPIFTAIISIYTNRQSLQNIKFTILGFLLVLFGLFAMDYNKISQINIGDLLAIFGSISFGIYSYLLGLVPKKFDTITTTKKSFLWGVIFLIIFSIVNKSQFHFNAYLNIKVWTNLIFLSFIASGLCFLMWKWSIFIIGARKTSNYIYLVPIINAFASVAILNEVITLNIVFATIFILIGLYISQKY